MRLMFIKSLLSFLVSFSSALAEADNKNLKASNDIDSIIQLQQQIEALQSEIQQVDTDSTISPTLQTYNSVVNGGEDATTRLKTRLSKETV